MVDQSFRDMAWLVRPHVAGCPDAEIYYHFAEAVREHLARSKAWQFQPTAAFDLADDTAFPTITAGTHIPTDTYVVEPVLLKWDDGCEIPFVTRDQLDKIDSDWEQATGTKPKYWTSLAPGDWRVYPLLTAATTAQLYMRLAISIQLHTNVTAAGVEENLAYRFRSAWARGALAKLMAIPGKDWTNINLASNYGTLFEEDIAKAKSLAAADYGRPKRSVQYGGLGMGGSERRVTDDYGR